MSTAIRSHHCTAGALLILLLTSICATAQLNTLPRTRTSPAYAKVESKSGNISGTVVNESGQPLANAEVNVQPASPGGGPAKTIKTNREGIFKFSGLGSGSYYVSASMPAYVPKSPASRDIASSEDSVTLVLLKGGVITGTVTNPKGDPVVEIGIKVEMVVDERGIKSPSITYQSVTDDQGVYRVYGLPTGTYIVAADAAVNYSPTSVNAFAIDMPTYATSSSREGADEFSVRVGEETNNVDIRYRAERGNTISGIVNGLPTGNRGYAVTLTSLAEVANRRDGYFREANGEFVIEGVPDGDYHLVANAYWNDKENRASESMVLNVRGADIEGIQLTPAALASISGAVILKELKETAPECTDKRRPQFSEVNVTAWHRVIQDGKKKPQFVWRSRSSETPNAQGILTFRDLAASEYYFGVRLPGPQWYLESIAFVPQTGKPTDATRSWTTVKPGDQLSGLTFTLAQGAALVRGGIKLAEGQKLPDKLFVYLVPAETAQAEDALRYSAAPVSTAGHFSFGNVMPGRYWILAQRGNNDIRDEISKLRLPDAAETRSSLRHAAEQRKTEIELKPCQDLTFQLPL